MFHHDGAMALPESRLLSFSPENSSASPGRSIKRHDSECWLLRKVSSCERDPQAPTRLHENMRGCDENRCQLKMHQPQQFCYTRIYFGGMRVCVYTEKFNYLSRQPENASLLSDVARFNLLRPELFGAMHFSFHLYIDRGSKKQKLFAGFNSGGES